MEGKLNRRELGGKLRRRGNREKEKEDRRKNRENREINYGSENRLGLKGRKRKTDERIGRT